MRFLSKAIVMSNGGRATLPKPFYKEWFPFMKGKEDKVILADNFL